MTDVFTKEKRSWVMSRIRSKNTKVEKILCKKMRSRRIKFVQHPKLIGHPDFLVSKNIVVFVDGCFWHGCPKHYIEPKTRKSFWKEKIAGNMKRDKLAKWDLRRLGYKVIRLWEHQIENSADKCIERIIKNC
jgi:DNA mismatch endonuclease (patch repair protein)